MNKIGPMFQNHELLSDIRGTASRAVNALPPLPEPRNPFVGTGPTMRDPLGVAVDVLSEYNPALNRASEITRDFAEDIAEDPEKLKVVFVPASRETRADPAALDAAQDMAVLATIDDLSNLRVASGPVGQVEVASAGSTLADDALARLEGGRGASPSGPTASLTYVDKVTGAQTELYEGDGFVLIRPAEGEVTLYIASDAPPEKVPGIFEDVASIILGANAAEQGLEVDQGEWDRLFVAHVAAFMMSEADYIGLSFQEGDTSHEDDRAERAMRARRDSRGRE